MTFSEEFTPDEEQDFGEGGGGYPTAFGITFTPQVTGLGLGLLGVCASVYILLNLVMPAYENYSTLKIDEAEKQSKVDEQKSGKLEEKMLDADRKLRESEALRAQVLSLFSSENSLKTMLLDVNNLVEKHPGAKLVSFKPEGTLTVVNDGSLGQGVNNRLKRQRFTLTIEADFQATQTILQDLERLQPLLLIKGLSSQLSEEKSNVKPGGGETIAQGQNQLKTSFSLDAILPLSQEELVDLAPKPEEGDEKKGETDNNKETKP
ncbi:pilus assembly protein [Crocosphaera sp. UHCC 0190]|uniref:pilus assembly protein n=1 Tax=Crocosphaera sp. UHCC 0190 TaxID=3110246 RepID=UPI002B1EE7A3|nr:pilus assembly protein [Crocosphaera sp. UHCC 0190]MEA5510728.1 pilus assembly protein [Crocosphaera sp. UHCC 0190]